MPVKGKRSIADTYVSILPETSRVASEIAKSFRAVDTEARQAGRRWRDEINDELGDVRATVNLDGAQAKADATRLKGEIERDPVTIKANIDVDRSGLDNLMGGGGGGGGSRGGFGGGGGGGGGLLGGLSGLKINLGLVGIGLLPAAAVAISNVAGAVQELAGAGAVVPGVMAGLAASTGVAKMGISGVKDAIDAVNKASDGTKASVDAANKALAALPSNAAETAKTVVGLKGTLTDLKNISSQNMFAGVSDGLKGLTGNLLPTATRGIDGISKGLNQNILQAMKSLGSDSSKGFLDRILGNTGDAQSKLTAAIDPAIHAFGVLTAAGSDSLPRLATAVGAIADRFNSFITAADADGRLAKWIDKGLDGFTSLGNIVLNLGKTFTGITEAAGGGAGLLSTIEKATGAMSTFTNSDAGQERLKQFFADGRDLLGQLKDIAVQLGPVLGDVFTVAQGATGLWLPLIRDALGILNGIPGGTEAVVAGFAVWKTISFGGLLSSLDSVSGRLGKKGGGGILGQLGAALALFSALDHASQNRGPNDGPDFGNQATMAGGGALLGWEVGGPIGAAVGGLGGAALAPTLDMLNPPGPAQNGVLPGAPGGDIPTVGGIPMPGLISATPAPVPMPAPVVSGWGTPDTTKFQWGRPDDDTPAVPALSSYTAPVVTSGGSGSSSSSAAVAAGSYGLPGGSAISYGADGFPDWVYQVAAQFGLKASTYSGHQETNRGEAGFAGNPNDLNRGIDWSGPVENMQRFASYLATIPGDLEQVIFKNPNTGAETGIAGGHAVGHDYYADDYGGHTDHVHTRQSSPIPLPGMAGYDSMGLGTSPALAGLAADGTMPAGLRDAYQRVQDQTNAVATAQMRLDELNAKGTATALQRKTAEDALAKAQRERADAVEDLATKQQKLNQSSSKGAGSDLFGGLGQDLVGGIAQAFGFDGSLFADPTQFGITKLLSGATNWATQPAGGTSGSGSAGGGAGGGGGSLLSAIMPQAFGALRLGGQDNAPVPFMGGMPGYAEGSAMAAGAQFATSSLHGAASAMGATPGPGNAASSGDTINIYGGGEPVADSLRDQYTIPRARQAVRP